MKVNISAKEANLIRNQQAVIQLIELVNIYTAA
jgi:hypothetical protein